MSPSLQFTAHGGEYDAKMCRLCKLVREGISASSYQPRHRNTRNRTDLALRPKATGNNTTLVGSMSRDVSPYRPHVVPLPFPLLGLCLKVVPLLSPTGICNTRKVRCVRRVCDEFDEKPKNSNRVQVKRRKFFPRPNYTRVFLIQAAGKCCKRLL